MSTTIEELREEMATLSKRLDDKEKPKKFDLMTELEENFHPPEPLAVNENERRDRLEKMARHVVADLSKGLFRDTGGIAKTLLREIPDMDEITAMRLSALFYKETKDEKRQTGMFQNASFLR